MPFHLNILTTFLNYFGTRKVLSSSDSTELPNIFTGGNPSFARRHRSARLRAARSAARLHQNRSIAGAANSSTGRQATAAGTGTAAHEVKQRGTKYQRASMRSPAGKKHLRRCNTIVLPQAPTRPQPPGALVIEPSFVVPAFPGLDDRTIPPPVAHKILFDAVAEGRQAILRAEEERGLEEHDEEADYARRLEEVLKQAHETRRRWDAEEDRRKAEAARQQAERENFLHAMQEIARQAREARYRALEEEFRRRKAEQENFERERRERQRQEEERREEARREQWRREEAHREQQRLEEARQEQQRRERERLEHEAAQSDPITQSLRLYLDKWAVLRFKPDEVKELGFDNMPWPSFAPVPSADKINDEQVRTFMTHLKRLQGIEKWTNFVRQQLLCWHPDKFEGPLFGKVIEEDREGVWELVLGITSVLNKMSADHADH